jgi:hypothetical protein
MASKPGLWHRKFIAHSYSLHGGRSTTERHSHCPKCGNIVGEMTTACAACGARFDRAKR